MIADPQSGTASDATHGVGRAERLLRRAAGARQRAADRMRLHLADLGQDESARLDDQLRALCEHHLRALVAVVDAQLREGAARLLVARGDAAHAVRLRDGAQAGSDTTAAHGVSARSVADAPIAAELIARLRHDLIASRLPDKAAAEDEPSLLVRLADVAQPTVGAAARALLAAESRRREALAFHGPTATELPAELHHRLVWRVAASLRGDGSPALDRALADAALQALASYDEGERAEAVAMRLALAIDARPHELAPLIEEALNDRRLSLIVAVLAQAARLSFEQVRGLLVEADDERWWLLLRSVALDPLLIARIGLALAQADPRRHAGDLPDLLDALHLIDVEDARAALAPMRLPEDFRIAVEAMERGA
ncbi:hypothetical protein SAMN05192583_2251 [Sphingomonas gellani]|uniref:DUF2336 domain-containing protein n=1 Tax=Sphingomonas gellani TaxID=1166340 RepID=A0A1H8EPB4_9SPHN|nr:hypothetical protein [Sphingomonas gellani]SEN21236.1 hypothetical protein SAMN05192583_2251 [Sphingomonas gellani]